METNALRLACLPCKIEDICSFFQVSKNYRGSNVKKLHHNRVFSPIQTLEYFCVDNTQEESYKYWKLTKLFNLIS